MPKQKTHKGAKKRFRISANGKLMRKQAGKRHLNSHKSGTRKQRLRATITETDKMAKKIIKRWVANRTGERGRVSAPTHEEKRS